MSDVIAGSVHEYLRSTMGMGASDTGFNVKESAVINVLVVGRSQTGKTTLIESLKSTSYVSVMTGFSDTRNVTHHPIVIHDKETDQYYQINLIDTIGLGEHARDPGNTRTDDEILKLAVKFLVKEITSLHAVIFVSKAGDTHLSDIEVFNKLKTFLGDEFKTNCMMILTHCDGYSTERFNGFAESIRTNTASREIAEYCTLGIFPHGTLNFDQLEQFKEERHRNIRQGLIGQKFELITPMRKAILKKLIGQQNQAKPVQELQEIMSTLNEERERMIAAEVKRRRSKCFVM